MSFYNKTAVYFNTLKVVWLFNQHLTALAKVFFFYLLHAIADYLTLVVILCLLAVIEVVNILKLAESLKIRAKHWPKFITILKEVLGFA